MPWVNNHNHNIIYEVLVLYLPDNSSLLFIVVIDIVFFQGFATFLHVSVCVRAGNWECERRVCECEEFGLLLRLSPTSFELMRNDVEK